MNVDIRNIFTVDYNIKYNIIVNMELPALLHLYFCPEIGNVGQNVDCFHSHANIDNLNIFVLSI